MCTLLFDIFLITIPKDLFYTIHVHINANYFMSYSDTDVETYETSLGTRPSNTSIDEVNYTLVCVHVLY